MSFSKENFTDRSANQYGVKFQPASVEIAAMKMLRSGVIYFLVLCLNLSQGCFTPYTRNERHSAKQSRNNQKRQGRNGDLFSVPGWCMNDRTGKRVPQKSAWTVQQSLPKEMCVCLDSQINCTVRVGGGCPTNRQHLEKWTGPQMIKERAKVQLNWLTEHSMEMKISTTIQLTEASNIPGEPTPCLFSGKVENEEDSTIAVSGCKGDEDVSVTMASRWVPGGYAELSISHGITYAINLGGNFGQPKPQFIKEKAKVQLSWLSDHSMEMKMNKIIQLSETSNIPGEPTPCLFSGKVENDPDSRVAVSGCQGDDDVSVTMASRWVPGGYAELSISHGITYAINEEGTFDQPQTFACLDGQTICDAKDLKIVDRFIHHIKAGP